VQDTPSYLNFPGEDGHVRYGEGIFVGYRGYDAADRPVAYPFGHGLSYTRFDHADLSVATTGSHDSGDLTITVRLTVTNTGAVAGREVVQLYVGAPHSSVTRPPRELRGFTTVYLAPGERTDVEFTVGSRDLAYWSTAHRQWVVEPGEFTLEVGASSRDIRLRAGVHVDAAPQRPPLDGMATLQEWLTDPRGAAAIRAAIGVDGDGRPRGILGDRELLRIIGNFPLATLAAFPGLGISHDLVRTLGGDSDI
jgi:beta-glucosidase